MSDNVSLKRPIVEIRYITEENDFIMKYDTDIKLPSDGFLGESLLDLTVKNALGDDTGVFTFVVSGDTFWDKVLVPNDIVIIKFFGNGKYDLPDRPTVMVGLISEVTLEGDYGNDGKIYRITGQSMAKAFMNLHLGMINAVNVNIAEIGWLPDKPVSDGTNMFVGSSAKNIVMHLYDRFKGFMNYNFVGNGDKTSIDSYMELDVNSWTEYESLSSATPFINFEGSLKQLLDDVAQKPFNELFFESMENEKARLIMRPTPFDEDKWYKLPTNYLNTNNIIQENISRSDNEAYSVFVVNVEDAQALGFNALSFGVYPQTFLPLIAKYGYSALEVDNRYLIGTAQSYTDSSDNSEATTEANRNEGDAKENLNTDDTMITNATPLDRIYNRVIAALEAHEFKDIRLYKNQIITNMQNVDNRISKDIATQLFDYYLQHQGLTLVAFSSITGITSDNAENTKKNKYTYNKVISFLSEKYPKKTIEYQLKDIKEALLKEFSDMNAELATQIANQWLTGFNIDQTDFDAIVSQYKDTASTASGDVLKLFTQKIANWYCENPNFYSGDIKIVGDPNYRIGNRLLVREKQEDILWEFYIESVQHNFSYTEGYTTTLGVTRGMRGVGDRFSNLYGSSIDFKGGYLGELSLEEIEKLAEAEKAKNNNSGGGGSSSGGSDTNLTGASGSDAAMKALQFGLKYIKGSGYQTIYHLGAGRSEPDPFTRGQPFELDCSSFVYWCYRNAGVNLAGGVTGCTTWSFLGDPQLKKIQGYGTKTDDIFNNMRKGDLVFFGTGDTHVGLYAGDKKFVGWNGASEIDYNHGCELEPMTDPYWWSEFQGRVLRYG